MQLQQSKQAGLHSRPTSRRLSKLYELAMYRRLWTHKGVWMRAPPPLWNPKHRRVRHPPHLTLTVVWCVTQSVQRVHLHLYVQWKEIRPSADTHARLSKVCGAVLPEIAHGVTDPRA